MRDTYRVSTHCHPYASCTFYSSKKECDFRSEANNKSILLSFTKHIITLDECNNILI
jgi:hypothetical protein